MSDFEPRPKGTVMYGEFADSGDAERALRVLQNAGYARAEVVAGARALPTDSVVVVVDAAAAGAVRAAEILEEHGAQLRSSLRIAPPPDPKPEPTQHVEAVPLVARQGRKPRVRERVREETVPPPEDITIVTRSIDVTSPNQSSRPPPSPPSSNASQPMLP